MRKIKNLHKICKKCVVFLKNLHSWQEFYTTAGRGGRDKLRYESSTLILYKELSSTIFQSCEGVSQ